MPGVGNFMKKDQKNEQPEQEKSEGAPINKMEDILKQVNQESLTAPEPALLNRLTAAFRRKQARKADRPSLDAALKFDNWTQTPALGMRGSAVRERQILFSEGDFDLDLQIVKDAENSTFTIRGQLLQIDEVYPNSQLEGIELRLSQTDGNQSLRVTDEYGRFHFSYCAPGEYTLQVILDDHDIILKPLTIG
jgi:hypothetical protein